MMQYKNQITRENALDLIKRFAREYRKELGKTPGEIIIVGGASIMMNYSFRDSTQDFDVILKTASGVKDVIARFADENNLPRDWMNSDFMKTSSYSDALSEVSKHLCSLNNGTLEIRTVSGIYLIAMKLRSHREYRNDISDVVGILIEERSLGNEILFEQICDAYDRLYHEVLSGQIRTICLDLCNKGIEELRDIYLQYHSTESRIEDNLVTYMDHGADINVQNVDVVVRKIKEKMKKE